MVAGEAGGWEGRSKGFLGMIYRLGGNSRNFFAIYR